MAGKQCDICGQPSGMYPLCKKHLEMKSQGLVMKDEKTKKWQIIDNNPFKPTYNKVNNYEKCIICEEEPDEFGWKYLCRECYGKVLEYTRELDKNMSINQFKDYYFNLKTNIYKMTGFEKFIKPNCQKLIAIAKANDRYNNNDELLNKVEKDVIDLIAKKRNKDFIKEEVKVIEHNEKVQKREYRSQDGHFLDSQIEVQIDDLLWQRNIVHAVHYPVFDITERNVYCDWYIPVINNKGIYIELWGMDKKDYIDNKNEKIELYNKHNLKLIEFDKKALNDTLDITRELMNKIKRYTKELKEED